MLVTQITNHVQAAQARLIQQYAGKTGIKNLLASLVSEMQNLEDAIFAMDGARQFYNGTSYPAIGEQLDGIGSIVGCPRNGMQDAQYLLFILGTIAENYSDTTMPTLLRIFNLIFGTQEIFARPAFPAALKFAATNCALSPGLFGTVVNMLQESVGAGISIGYVGLSSLPATQCFRLGSVGKPAPAGGFGSTTLGPGGGKLIKLLYSSPNQ